MKVSHVVSRLLDLIFVAKCVNCQELIGKSEDVLCRVCRAKYDMLCHRKCKSCGIDICLCDCTKEGVSSQGVWRLSKLCAYLPAETSSPFKAMLYYLKHKNNSDVRELFASEMAEMIKKKCPDYRRGYTICFVPRSKASYRKHGYDHMQRLSCLLSEKLGISYQNMFFRNESSRVQKELGRASRFENTQKSIELRKEYRGDGDALLGRRFILIDDVCVTGASLGRCATLLISEGAIEVRCFVIGSRP